MEIRVLINKTVLKLQISMATSGTTSKAGNKASK